MNNDHLFLHKKCVITRRNLSQYLKLYSCICNLLDKRTFYDKERECHVDNEFFSPSLYSRICNACLHR